MATQTILLTGSETYTGNPPGDDYIVTDNTAGTDTASSVGSNTLTLGDGTDQITLGSGGNNTIVVGDGSDLANDILMVGGASNTITVNGSGDNQITTVGGINTITVGSGSNTITLGNTGSSTPDTVTTAAGNNTVFVSAAAISGDTVMGAATTRDGTTNQLVLTTAGTMNPVNVNGFATWLLANNDGANSLTLSQANFTDLPGGLITVIGGDSGNTIDASALSAAQSVTIDAGAGTDALTGGAGNDRFVFAPSNLGGDTVDGGAGNNTIELMAGGAGTLAGLGTDFVNINTVVLDANAAWTIGFDNPAAFTGIISGFVAGDTFDLATVPFDSAGSANLVSDASVTNQLQITENGQTYDIDLDPTQSFAGEFFHLAGDGGGSGTNVIENNTPCYCRGTLILTDRGEVSVEALRIGDKVVTISGEAKPIVWIGRRCYAARFVASNRALLPIRIAAGALAGGIPARDLWLSPEHALSIDGTLVPARLLVNGTTVVQSQAAGEVDYFHIELAAHDIIFAEGAAAETFVDCDNRGMFHNGGAFAALHPDDKRPAWAFCPPRLEEASAELAGIRAVLLSRAAALGCCLSDDPDLHLLIDGGIICAQSEKDGVHAFTIPAGSGAIWLVSRSAVPAEVAASSQDRRRLGVPLKGIVLCEAGLRTEIGHGHASLCEGFHDDEAGHRWTDGCARLPEQLLCHFAGEATLEVTLIENGLRYPCDMPDAITRRRRYRRSA